MKQTKAIFLIQKYRAILRSAIFVESAFFLVSLIDILVAGNIVSDEALAAVGLVAPIIGIGSFLTSVINSGTCRDYVYYTGRFEKQRANEIFSQGLILSLLTGMVYAALCFLAEEMFIRNLSVSPVMEVLIRDYYGIIPFYCMFDPITTLLDNILVANGGENITPYSNVIYAVSNLALSLLFAQLWGVKGIALASLTSEFLFITITVIALIAKRTSLTFTWCVHLYDLRRIVQGGAVRASTFAMTALMTLLLNALVASRFDGDCLLILVLVEQIVGFSTVFLGMSCAIRPVIGTLRGEGNTKAARQLMLTAAKDMILSGALVSALVAAFAPYLVEVFGIRDVALFHEAVSAVRITSTALFLYAPMTLFFNYYSFIEKNLPALFLSSLKDFLCPLVCVMFAVTINKSHVGLWYALAFASVLAGITFALLILKTYGREQFPFLIPTDRDNVIFIYDFELNVPNVSALLEEADQILCEHHYPLKTRNSLRLYLEETLLMMEEINTGKRVKVECNIVCEETGVRIILRDSGRIMDLTDPDAEVSSLRQYILSNMMAAMQQKTEYMVTTGYNRHELFLTATAGDGDR